MSGSDRDALPYVFQLLGGPPEFPGMVGRPFRMSGCWREALLVLREWSGDPTGCPEAPSGRPVVVGCPSRMFESGREAFPNVRKWSGGPPGCPGVVRSPSLKSGSGWEALPDVRE